MPSASQILRRRAATTFAGMRLKSKRCTRERMVSGILFTSVVAKMNLTCGGGSSSVFRSALNASFVSMCTSSMM